MKLGILCTIANTFGRKGFYNSQEIGLAKALASKGHSVSIYKATINPADVGEQQIEKNVKIQYFCIPHIGVHGYLNCAKYIETDLDAILCFADHQIFLPHVERFCRKNDIVFVPYIGTALSQDDGTFHSKIMNMLYYIGTRRVYKRIPVISKNEQVKNDLLRLGISDVAVGPVGIDFSLMKQDFRSYDRQQLRSKYGYSENDVLICCVGKLVEIKQPLKLIELFQRVKDVKPFKMVIVGEGELKSQLLNRIQEYGLEDQIQQIDRVPYENMWEIYAMSDYFLNVSRREVFGMAVLEAVYYETSVAASCATGPEVILNGMKGHLLCRNDDEFVQWLSRPYPSKEDLEESSKKVCDRFTWDLCAEEYLNIVCRRRKGEADHY